MEKSDFTVGTRVRLARSIGGNYPGAMYHIQPGAVGSVIEVNHDPEREGWEALAKVRFDKPIEDLSDWQNVLEISEDGDATPKDLEVVPCV